MDIYQLIIPSEDIWFGVSENDRPNEIHDLVFDLFKVRRSLMRGGLGV